MTIVIVFFRQNYFFPKKSESKRDLLVLLITNLTSSTFGQGLIRPPMYAQLDSSSRITLEQSPTQVLTEVNVARLQWSHENWYFQVDKLLCPGKALKRLQNLIEYFVSSLFLLSFSFFHAFFLSLYTHFWNAIYRPPPFFEEYVLQVEARVVMAL